MEQYDLNKAIAMDIIVEEAFVRCGAFDNIPRSKNEKDLRKIIQEGMVKDMMQNGALTGVYEIYFNENIPDDMKLGILTDYLGYLQRLRE